MLKASRLSITVLILTAIFILAGGSGASAMFFLNDWKYVKSITLPADIQEESLVEFTPDLEVFTGSAPGLSDLRIITGGSTEIPYRLEVRCEVCQSTPLRVRLRDKSYSAGGQTEFTAVLVHAGQLHNEIEFETPTSDFHGTAIVDTSYDGTTWNEAARETVFNVTIDKTDFTISNTRVKYPETAGRYLRVTILDDDGESVDVTGATVFSTEGMEAEEISWPASPSIMKMSTDPEEHLTFVEIDTKLEKVPGYRMEITTADSNFRRRVSVQISDDRESWATVLTSYDIYDYSAKDFSKNYFTIVYPESTLRYLRLIIHDDYPPITVKGVTLWSLRRRLVFTADPRQSYHLYYGNPDAPPPSYNTDTALPDIPAGRLPEASLSSQATNVHFAEESVPATQRLPWLLPLVIAAAVMVVVVIVLSIARRYGES